ncbi:MAG: hypothetical protein Ct9H300mP26_3670 [Acidimicrobiales bacterium]|nr:MAG: hypothetical protein Ct9H300mP26_3670 [Acidimicrobiales bacterium]
MIEAKGFDEDPGEEGIRSAQHWARSTTLLWPHWATIFWDDPPLANSRRDVEVRPYQNRSQNHCRRGTIVTSGEFGVAEGVRVLSDYRVLDLTDERGHLAAFILAQMGAEVISIEPPAGSSARRLAPFAEGIDDGEHSLHHWAYNRGKKSVVLDLDTPDGISQLRRLIMGADVIFDSFDPGVMESLGLTPSAIAELNPQMIDVSITAFGGDGPKANWEHSDLTLQAAAGNMALTGERTDLRCEREVPCLKHLAMPRLRRPERR